MASNFATSLKRSFAVSAISSMTIVSSAITNFLPLHDRHFSSRIAPFSTVEVPFAVLTVALSALYATPLTDVSPIASNL